MDYYFSYDCEGAAVAAGFSIIFNKVVYTSEAKLYISVPKTSDKILIRDNANDLYKII